MSTDHAKTGNHAYPRWSVSIHVLGLNLEFSVPAWTMPRPTPAG
jgi:hypothetical protein